MKTLKNPIKICLALFMVSCLGSCTPPEPPKSNIVPVKNNFIILLDLSDRIIVQPDQPERDKEIIRHIYTLFEESVKKNLYIKSRDEIKVAIAPQRGVNLRTDIFEDQLYINMEKMNIVQRRAREKERRQQFFANLDTLYRKARFSTTPEDYHGADIWQYFYEDLRYDYVEDTLTENYLFILTDGYPTVGKNRTKLEPVNAQYPALHTIILEAAPWEKDLEWDRIMEKWSEWFEENNIPRYTIIKRQAISKEKEMIEDIVFDGNEGRNLANSVKEPF